MFNNKRWLLLALLAASALAQTNPTNNFHFGRPDHNAGPGWGLELNTNSGTIDSLWNNINSGCAADGLHAITWDPITHFNCTAITGIGSGVWGGITGILSNQVDLQNALNLKAGTISPTFTGIPLAPTAANGTNTQQVATTAFVIAQIGPAGGVSSWNGRVGGVVPTSGDYTFSQIGATPTTLAGYGITDAVPNTRTVAGHPLSANIAIAFADIITTPTTLAGYGITDAVPSSRTVNGKPLTANLTLDLSSSDFAGQTLAAARMPAFTGDCTTSVNTVATTCLKINGNSFPSGVSADQVPVGTAANTFSFASLPDCHGGSNAYNYTQSTHLFSCLAISTLTNPLTTTGDVIYGVGAVPTRLAGPTGVNNVPQVLISVPSGGVATAPAWSVMGVPTNAQVGTTYTVLATDRNSYVSFNQAASIAVTLPQAGTTGFGTNFVFVTCDIGGGTASITPTTSTISFTDGSSYTSGASVLALSTGKCAWIYSDNTNYFAIVRAGGGTGTVTHTPGPLTASAIVLGNGSADAKVLGSLGTTTTLVHGNAAGDPTFGQVVNADIAAATIDLTAKVTGLLPTANGGTNANLTAANGAQPYSTASAIALLAAGTAKQIYQSGGVGAPNWITFPDTSYSPSANCVNAVAGSAWSTGATPAALCRAGTNNKSAELSPWGAADVGTTQFHIDKDTDLTTTLPQVMLELTSTDAVNAHTIIMQEQVACAKEDGTTTDDVAFNAARSFTTITLNGNANRTWSTTLALNSTDLTGCAAPGIMWVKISRTTDTATNVGVYGLNLTQFRLLTSQAN